MSNVALVAFTILFGINSVQAFPTKPNPVETTGELCNPTDPDFSELRYQEKIPYCKRNVEYSKRQEIYDAYRIPAKCRHRYTIDHFIPLSVGGSNDDKNLWPEHKLVKATRPNLELETYEALKAGKISQSDAIQKIVKVKTEMKHSQITNKSFNDECDTPEIDLE